MILGTITGSVWATRKAECLNGQTFLVVDTLKGVVVAVDYVGAGTGDKVLLVMGTAAAKFSMDVPVDAAIVAIVDPEGTKDYVGA